jgi:N-glycosylase/DNA lyase
MQTINIENSINSGQVFLWEKKGEFWYGINGQDVLCVSKNGTISSYQNQKIDFFRKKDNFDLILSSISKDKKVREAIKKFPGLRILRQDPFQCLISFIISANNNITKIKNNLENMTKSYGKKVKYKNQEFFLFPKPKILAELKINEIKDLGVGYRAEFIKKAAEMVVFKKINFEFLKKISYKEAKKIIIDIPGVGDKVADCVMLFSLDKLDATPIDRWMIRILQKYYVKKFLIETKSITPKQYNMLHEKIVNYFGEYAGYAQQFLFKMERENYQKKWAVNP